MTSELLKDIIKWDILNWSKALDFWSNHVDLDNKNFECLELGGCEGGLSLWLAMKGNRVICSDLELPKAAASNIHKKYACNNWIDYQAIDATNIPYEKHFDVIAFKSILGGIGRRNNALKKATIEEIHKALKQNGVLLFAENLEASFIHKFFRKHFVSWGNDWNYLKYQEIDGLFSSFKKISYITVGFTAAFGRNEQQRMLLGKFDRLLDYVIPSQRRYILIGIAEK